MERPHLTAIQKEILKTIDQDQFADFSYINPDFHALDPVMQKKLQTAVPAVPKKKSTADAPKLEKSEGFRSYSKKFSHAGILKKISPPKNKEKENKKSRPSTPSSASASGEQL